MKIIGLTGGIGSGKSTASQFLKELGAFVIDLDQIGHDVLQKEGGVYKQVLSAFGEKILAADGEIDRVTLGKIVFNNPEALERLNAITHPAIDKRVEEETEKNRRNGIKVMVMEAAAMLENHRSWQADEIWVVIAPVDTLVKRIKGRPGYTEETARSRIHSQLTNEERVKKADIVIMNDGTIDELKTRVKDEWDKLLKRS
jgi:dephospho-CoA kinase